MKIYTTELTAEKDGISKEVEIGFQQLAKAANKLSLELEIEKAIQNKDCEKLNYIGKQFFETSELVNKDTELALKAFQTSRELGNEEALYCLADLYQLHKVNVDDETIIKTISEAAHAGYIEAMFFLGWRYKEGQGVEMDPDKSIMWFEKALLNDSLNMQKLVKEMGYDDYENYKEAFPYKYHHSITQVA